MTYDELAKLYPAIAYMTREQAVEFIYERGISEGQNRILEAWKADLLEQKERLRA